VSLQTDRESLTTGYDKIITWPILSIKITFAYYWMDEWMDWWMDGWIGWMNGWMDVWR